MTREWPALVLGTLIVAGLATFVFTNLRVTTDITHFLPRGERDSEIDLARRIATGELSRTLVLLLEARDQDEAVAASRVFEDSLRAEPAVAAALAALDGGPPAGVEEALWTTYEGHRLGFFADSPEAAAERIGDAGVHAAVAELKRRLASPMSSLVSRVAPADPFLVLPSLFDAIGGTGAGLGVADGRFVTADGTAAVLFLTTTAKATDSTIQRPLLQGVQNAFARTRAAFGDHLRLLQSGAHRHAIAAEASMQADMQRVSTISVVGMVVLYLLLFRSLRPALLCLPVLGIGFLAGTACCIAVFGEVHGLTLAFGSALLGVSVDFSLHFYAHHALVPHPDGPRATLRRIQGSLVLCAATTVTGFVALLIATFPGLRELSLFAAVGLCASLGATWLVLPGLTGTVRTTRLCHGLTSALRRLEHTRGRARWLLFAAPLLIVATAAIGLPFARWDDGVKGMNRIDPALKAEDDAVQARVVRFEQRRVVVASGTDEQEALAHNERVLGALRAAKAAGEIGDFGSASPLLPSAARQESVADTVRGDATLWPRLQRALAEAGFVADAFLPFAEQLAQPAPEPITPKMLDGTPLGALVRPFRADGAEGHVWLSFVHDLRDERALRERIGAIDGCRLLDIEGTLTTALSRYRGSMQDLLALGVVAVIVLVWLRHRRLRPTLIACLPPLLAAAGTVGALSLAGVPMNLMTLMALLMIVSMGDDYGIFLVDDQDEASRDATHLSVLTSSLTTVLGFGLLALSAQPALFSIGIVAAVGILFCLVLALSTGALFAYPRAA